MSPVIPTEQELPDAPRRPDPGTYIAKIVDIQVGDHDENGNFFTFKSSKGYTQFRVIYEIVGGEFNGARVRDIITAQGPGAWKVTMLVGACGYDPKSVKGGSLDTDIFLNKLNRITLIIDPKFPDFAKVSRVEMPTDKAERPAMEAQPQTAPPLPAGNPVPTPTSPPMQTPRPDDDDLPF